MSKNARNTDPDTSHAGAHDTHGQLEKDRSRVYDIYRRSSYPLADFELEKLLGGACNGKWRKRRSDLTRDKVLVAVDKIINPATRKQTIRWGLRSEPLLQQAIAATISSLLPLMGIHD